MKRVHLVVLWHMHQPQYRDPESGRYVLPWTRLHALKDYWGMVDVLREFPNFHATFNVVPSLGMQLEEYASCSFKEPWFSLAFKNTDELTREDKAEIIARAFQVNHERLMSRWPRFVELFEWSRPAGGAQALVSFTPRDWRDLQLLSQLAWMEESWFEKDDLVSRLATKGKDYTEQEKSGLRTKQLELLGLVLPAHGNAAQSGQIELSTTPFYHPILPLICDSDIARVANPGTPLPRRAYRRPEDAREHLRLAREYHERVFGSKPAGLWPSEGSVSDQALTIAAEEGFSGSARMKASSAARSTSGFSAMAMAFPPTPIASINPGKCKLPQTELPVYFAITTCPTSSASFTAAWMPRPLPPISTPACGTSEKQCKPISRSRSVSSSTAKTPGNTIQGTAARFSASFTDASRTTRISARLLQRKPSPPPAEFPPPLEFSPPRGSTQISTCGLATPKTSRHGNYFGTPAKPTLGPLRLANKEERTPPPKPLSWKPANRFWPQRAATGAGGSAQSTAPRTTPSSTPSIGST